MCHWMLTIAMVSRFLRARPLMMKQTGPQQMRAKATTPTTMPAQNIGHEALNLMQHRQQST